MTLRYYYRDNDGDVVEITNPSRVRRGGTEASYQAEEGAVGAWELEVDDPDGTFNVRGYRIVYAQEDEALADEQHGVVWVGYTGERYISRLGTDSPSKRTEAGRTWRIGLHDLNTRLSWRINVGNDCDRPAESDLERVAWLMGTNEMSWLDDDDTYIDTTAAVDMDAVDYTGQALLDVADDCAQQSGRNYGLLWEYSGDEGDPIAIKLWYKFGASDDYPSAKKINNYRPDVEADGSAYYPSLDATLNRSPSRVAWGVYQVYDGGAVYQTLSSTAERFNKIDVTGRGENVKTAAQATFRANRYLGTVSNVETDRIEVSVLVEPADVNSILPFHNLQVAFTHLPGYGIRTDDEPDYVWMRVVERTVRDIAPGIYELGLTLMVPAQDAFDDSGGGSGGGGGGGVYALLSGSSGPWPYGLVGALYWGKTGDEIPNCATQGPFDFVDSEQQGSPWSGILVTDTGTINVIMVASVIGIGHPVNSPYTITWSILKNGIIVASESLVWSAIGSFNLFASWGLPVTINGLAVDNGDVISGQLSIMDHDMYFWRSPWGINPGVGNNRLEITGGSF